MTQDVSQLTEEQIEAEMDRLYKDYDQNYFDYNRYLNSLDYDTKRLWLPLIYGVMLGNNIKEFFSRIDWTKNEKTEITDDDGNVVETIYTKGVLVEPPCGELPKEVMLVCYHAKRLAPEVIGSELPGSKKDAQETYEKFKRDMLYGSDALSVIEHFEDLL